MKRERLFIDRLDEDLMLTYFAYGSNLSLEHFKDLCPDSNLIGPARLQDFSLAFTFPSVRWGGGAADIISKAGSVVWGLVYEISEQDLANLDRYESYPTGYDRFLVDVQSMDGPLKDVWTYFVVDKKEFLQPTERYLQILKDAARKFNFPEDYRTFLNSIR